MHCRPINLIEAYSYPTKESNLTSPQSRKELESVHQAPARVTRGLPESSKQSEVSTQDISEQGLSSTFNHY